MTDKHSEGPWTLSRHGVLNSEGEALFVTGSDGTVWWQNDADGRLMAAAPEMLAALKTARETFIVDYSSQGVSGVSYRSEALRLLIPLLDELLTKAEDK